MPPPRTTKRPIEKRKVPPGTRPGARLNPERNPVEPKVPGTRDRMRRPGTTTDPEELKRRGVKKVSTRAEEKKDKRQQKRKTVKHRGKEYVFR